MWSIRCNDECCTESSKQGTQNNQTRWFKKRNHSRRTTTGFAFLFFPRGVSPNLSFQSHSSSLLFSIRAQLQTASACRLVNCTNRFLPVVRLYKRNDIFFSSFLCEIKRMRSSISSGGLCARNSTLLYVGNSHCQRCCTQKASFCQ